MWPKGIKRGRDLRPIRNPEEGELKAAENAIDEPKTEAVMLNEEIEAPPTHKTSKYLPYSGKETLPNYTIVRGRVIPGDARYALTRGTGKRFKLLCYRRTPAGVERTLTRVLTNSGTDKPFFEMLKKAGIPGAF